jgi:hypothetical protein
VSSFIKIEEFVYKNLIQSQATEPSIHQHQHHAIYVIPLSFPLPHNLASFHSSNSAQMHLQFFPGIVATLSKTRAFLSSHKSLAINTASEFNSLRCRAGITSDSSGHHTSSLESALGVHINDMCQNKFSLGMDETMEFSNKLCNAEKQVK